MIDVGKKTESNTRVNLQKDQAVGKILIDWLKGGTRTRR
jgi:hypothetical protein